KTTIPAIIPQTDDNASLTFLAADDTTGVRPPGLPSYEPITTSTVVGFPDPPPPFVVKRALPNYKPGFPIIVRHVPGSDQLFVITQPKSYGPTAVLRFKDDPATEEKDAGKVLETP